MKKIINQEISIKYYLDNYLMSNRYHDLIRINSREDINDFYQLLAKDIFEEKFTPLDIIKMMTNYPYNSPLDKIVVSAQTAYRDFINNYVSSEANDIIVSQAIYLMNRKIANYLKPFLNNQYQGTKVSYIINGKVVEYTISDVMIADAKRYLKFNNQLICKYTMDEIIKKIGLGQLNVQAEIQKIISEKRQALENLPEENPIFSVPKQ